MKIKITQTTELTIALPMSPDAAQEVSALKSGLLSTARCAQVLDELCQKLTGGPNHAKAIEMRHNFKKTIADLLVIATALIANAALPPGIGFAAELDEEEDDA